MRVLILGGDGYLGWPTAMRFSARGHEVSLVDNFSRRAWHERHGTDSLTPIASLEDRIAAWQEVSGNQIRSYVGAIEDAPFLEEVIVETKPEAVIHYGEQASAPYSMASCSSVITPCAMLCSWRSCSFDDRSSSNITVHRRPAKKFFKARICLR